MWLFAELKRRNVFRVGAAYLVSAWLLIQVAETIFPLFGFDGGPARIAVVVLAIGFPLVLIFSWAYELTPEGLKLERDVERSASLKVRTGRNLDRAIIAGLALALSYFAVDKFVLSGSREAVIAESARQEGRSEALAESYGEKSIVVLPFVNMSDDASNEYFSDGISEELLNLLTKIKQLRVISRSSAFSYKGKDIDIPTVAAQLNVAHVLEGSVRKTGNRVRITAQLLDARSDTHLWSETYDRMLDDVFAIQEEIAAKVVEQLHVTLFGENLSVEKTDSEAHALYLQARYLFTQGTAEGFAKGIELLQKALAVDPLYVLGWDGLASIYINQELLGLRPANDGFELAREAANNALSIRPEFARAHEVLGWVAKNQDQNLEAAAKHYIRALELNSGDVAIVGGAAALLQHLGRLEEAIALQEYAVVRDPANPITHYNLGNNYAAARRYDDAIASLNTVLTLSPDFIGAHYGKGIALLTQGDVSAAFESFSMEGDDEYRLKGMSMALYSLNREAEFEESFAELRDRWGSQWPAEIAQVYAWIGDADSAFDWLQRALEIGGSSGWGQMHFDRLFANLWTDQRWDPFMRQAGVSRAQLASVDFSIKLPE